MSFLFEYCKEITNFALEKKTKTVKDMNTIVKGIEISIHCQVVINDEVLFEGDNVAECRKWARDENIRKAYEIRWCAAEVIDRYGNINIPSHGNTRKEAVTNLFKNL